MQSTDLSRPRRRRARLALAAALLAVGCSGSTGGGCGSSCGGAFKTTNADGTPMVYTGDRLANVAQVKLTKSGFAFLNKDHLNDILGNLNANAPLQIGCFPSGQLFSVCSPLNVTKVSLLIGDTNFSGTCDAADATPIHITFKDVVWGLDPVNNVLNAHIVTHLQTGDIYVRTVEEHSSICSGTSAIQARVKYDDELVGLPQQDTAIDLAINFTTTPDGRLEFNFDNNSIATIVQNFQPGALVFDGHAGIDPAPPSAGSYFGDGCDSGNGTYSVMKSSTQLNCSEVFDALNANCDVTQDNNGALCTIVQYVRGYLFDYLKNTFKDRIVSVLRQQLDNARCQRSHDNSNPAIAAACDSGHPCPNDDDSNPLTCDLARGVCKPRNDPSTDPFNCEPVALAISGQMDASGLTQSVGFPLDTRLNVFAGLGSKGVNGGARIDSNGLQLAAEAGTQPASNAIGLCVPPVFPDSPPPVPAMDFDDGNNKPASVIGYDAGFSLASAMLNRGFLDAYNSGMLCVAVTNQTTAFISSGLFKTFLPSLGLVTGGNDVPMKILLRPTQPPFVRVGKNTIKKDANNNDVPDDPLITLSFKQMNLDFYALVDQRQVRIFTLQADLQLPLDLRTFADPQADTLQPVLGGLDTVLTNIRALSPDGGDYAATRDMLAEDPGVVKDLLGAAVRLAQPLLAGVIKPVVLPSMMGLKFAVRGIAGAVPMTDVTTDGYNHLAIWAQVGACGGTTGVLCEQYTVKTEARVARSYLPGSLKEVRDGARPELELDVSALSARSAQKQFSYRVDGAMWSPWLSGPKLTLRDPLFLVQGHHLVQVTAREAGDDHTMDMNPAAIDFFVSYEPPSVSLVQREDGALITRAKSGASPLAKLSFSYRLEGDTRWTEPGPARLFTQEQLGGRGLYVSVSDEAGRSAQAHFGEEEGTELARAGVTGGCSQTGGGTWALFGLLALVALRRQRKGSSSRG